VKQSPTSPEYDSYRAVRTFSALDGLRCAAVVSVVWHHMSHRGWIGSWVPAAHFGFLGVDLFFVISGFLIVTLLLRESSARGEIALRRFYVRRVLRIFPLYYGLLAAFSLLYFVVRPGGAGAAAFRSELPVLLLYLSNWIPVSGIFAITWSLAVEEQFYCVWPPIEKWLSKHSFKLASALAALSYLFAFGVFDAWLRVFPGWSEDEPAFLRQTTFGPILLGVMLAHTLHHPERYRAVRRWLGNRAAAPLLLFAVVVVCSLLPADIRGPYRLLVHLVLLALLASTVIREDHGLRPLLTWAPIARVGVLSYGIYLLHHIPIGLVDRFPIFHDSGLPFLGFVVAMALTVGMAELSFRFLETPFLKLRNRFR
jgi:peptidoglycan/LPS O-acetylase OafA/YrhL